MPGFHQAPFIPSTSPKADALVASPEDAWLRTPLGDYVRGCEQVWFDAASQDLFGFNALQIGMRGLETLRANRMPQRLLCAEDFAPLLAQAEALPFASQSLDLVACPHVLEFSSHPHQVLREIERILRPEGRLLLSGFNPWSLWGLRRKLQRRHSPQDRYPWSGTFIHLSRIKDWLALLGFEIIAGRMSCYGPPINRATWPQRFAWLEAAGDRWWALGGGVYMLHAVKRVPGVRLLTPRRATRWQRQTLLAPGAGRWQGRVSTPHCPDPQAKLPHHD